MKERNHIVDRIFIGFGKWIYKKLGITLTIIFSLTLLFSLISFIVYQISHKTYGFDLSDKNNIGDALGGLTSPFIGIMGVVLTFLAFYVQYDFNKKQMKIIENQNELVLFESFKQGLDYLLKDKTNFYLRWNDVDVDFQNSLKYHLESYFFNIADISITNEKIKPILNKENIHLENSNLLNEYFHKYFKIFDYIIKSDVVKKQYSRSILKSTLINHFNTLDLIDKRIFVLLLTVNRDCHIILELLTVYHNIFKELFEEREVHHFPLRLFLTSKVTTPQINLNDFFKKMRDIIDSTQEEDI